MGNDNLLNNPFNNLKLKEVCQRVNEKHIEISKFDRLNNYNGRYYYGYMSKFIDQELEKLNIIPNLYNKDRLLEIATLHLDKFQI